MFGIEEGIGNGEDCRLGAGHMPSASLGQYATLSFIVIGRGQKTEVGGQTIEGRLVN
jgi:hypothetical protein